MTLKEMREKVLNELEYVDKRPKLQQSELRAAYWSKRMHSLGKKAKGEKTAFEVLQECIEFIQREYPGFEFRYNKTFFRKARKRTK